MEQIITEVNIANWDVILEKMDMLVEIIENLSMMLLGAIVGLTIIMVMSRW